MMENGGLAESNQRKRVADDPTDSSDSSPEGAEKNITPSGRPKRRCTVGSDMIWNNRSDADEDEEPGAAEGDDADSDYNESPPSPLGTSTLRKVPPKPQGMVIVDMNTESGKDPIVVTPIIINAKTPTFELRNRKPTNPAEIEELKSNFRWIDYDRDTGKMRCNICIAANLKKWYIVANEKAGNIADSLRLHELSEEHKRSTGCDDGGKDDVNSAIANQRDSPLVARKGILSHKTVKKDVYCIPMEYIEPIPAPNSHLRRMLVRNSMTAPVGFCFEQSPAGLREDISKVFRSIFKLRAREVLQFDYLKLSKNRKELERIKMLHFDAKTVLSFVGDSDVYILLKQKVTHCNVNWKELISHEHKLQKLGSAECRDTMLKVMHRLSSGKHKKDSQKEERKFIDYLIHDYKLNNNHQLVYIGNDFDQLVLFAEKRRYEAFNAAHAPFHWDMQMTFNNIYRLYYWNGMEAWIENKVRTCPVCLNRHGKSTLAKQSIIPEKFTAEPNAEEAMLAESKTTGALEGTQNLASPFEGQETVFGIKENDSLLPFIKKERKDECDLLPPENIADNILNIGDMGKEDLADSSVHCTETMQAMYLCQQKGKFCDFEITLLPGEENDVLKPTMYKVHRIVMAVLSRRIDERQSSKIKLGGKISARAMERVLEFAYTGQISDILILFQWELALVSTTAMALDIKAIDSYVRKVRPDFVKGSARVEIVQPAPSVEQ